MKLKRLLCKIDFFMLVFQKFFTVSIDQIIETHIAIERKILFPKRWTSLQTTNPVSFVTK